MKSSDIDFLDGIEIEAGSLMCVSTLRSGDNPPNMVGKAVDKSGNEFYLTMWIKPGKRSYVATGFISTKEELLDAIEKFRLKMSSGNATDLMLKDILKRSGVEYKPSVKRVDSMPSSADFDEIP